MLNFWLDGWDQIRHYLLLKMCTMKNMPRPQTRKENKQPRQERGVVFDRCWRHSLRGRILSESRLQVWVHLLLLISQRYNCTVFAVCC